MKKEISWYVERSLTCWNVNAEHHRTLNKLNPSELPIWIWEQITMDFMTKLPRKTKGLLLFG